MSSANVVQGSSNAAQIWNFLANQGLSASAISGVLGNLQQESGFDPSAVNPSSGAYGIAQWLGGRYNNLQSFCQKNGYSWSSLQGQMNFLWYEMSGGDTTFFSALVNVGGISGFNDMSVTAAAEFFEQNFERAGGDGLGNRVSYANSWYSKYTGGDPFNSGSNNAGTTNYPSAQSNQNDNSISFPATNYSVVANSQRSGNILYGRRYRILVSNSSGIALDVSELHCTFDIQYVVNQTPPFNTITIYNLNPTTENFLLNYGDHIVVEAGYEGSQYGVIFEGDVIEPIRDKPDNVTYRLTINALASDLQLNQAFANFTLNRGQTQRSLVQNLASKTTVPTPLGDISPQLSDARLPRGKVVFGLTRDYLRQIAQGNNVALFSHDGKINLVHASDPPTDEIIDLTPESGLIGQPTQQDLGVSFQCLLNPAIKINTLVHIDNSLIQSQTFQIGDVQRPLDSAGIYRVVGVEHIGNTRGQDWYTKCTSVSQAGGIPGSLGNATQTIWGN